MLQMPKHLEINNYTSTAPRSTITSLASTSSMTLSNTCLCVCYTSKTVLRKVVSVPPCHFHATLAPRRNADRMFAITYSTCALTIVAVMVCLSRSARSIESTCPIKMPKRRWGFRSTLMTFLSWQERKRVGGALFMTAFLYFTFNRSTFLEQLDN